ncbi:uncharacterized protein LOC142354047 [Convolutriloba macropyga]|uniref:uncharacterized protein LOC142354047 n=1 Tax=Convolutriloba macropyga TaxID=536237 RepID=UPI003F525442
MSVVDTVLTLFIFFAPAEFMTYRNNHMNFIIGDQIVEKYGPGGKLITYTELEKIEFEIKNFSITAGQDPSQDPKISRGEIVKGTNKLTFEIGRKASSEVATWFNSLLNPRQHTLGESVSAANFALFGTLKFTLGSRYNGYEKDYEFEDIAFVQHHVSIWKNNWELGGRNCVKTNETFTVICSGTNSDGEQVSLHFATLTSEDVTISRSHELDLSNWMGDIDDSALLKDLIMPGSHDAGMSVTKNCDLLTRAGRATESAVKTQAVNITGQLMAGSRYFDIRPAFGMNPSGRYVLHTYHRSGSFGCDGETLDDVTDQVVAFLESHPTEIVILKVSHVPQLEKTDKKYVQSALRQHFLQPNVQQRMGKASDSSIRLSKINLAQLRGKMLVLFSYDAGKVNTSDGIFRYSENMKVYDRYAKSSSLSDMEDDQLGICFLLTPLYKFFKIRKCVYETSNSVYAKY